MKAGFYSPYFDVMGGAEKHLLDIAYVLNKQGYQVIFFANGLELKKQIVDRFGTRYRFIQYQNNWHRLNAWQRRTLTKKFELFFYQTDGSYFLSASQKNFVYIAAPDKKMIPSDSLFNKLKFKSWQPFFNSNFVKMFFSQGKSPLYGLVVHPWLDISPSNLNLHNKEKIILSVGRFFPQLHNKRHDILIEAFNYAQKHYPEFKNYKLILIGSYKQENADHLNKLKKMCQENPNIEIKTNLSYQQIHHYYKKAMLYWHAAGYGLDDQKQPDKVEHFGITIMEAMAYQCVPLAYKAGGPKEIIYEPTTGFLYTTKAELVRQSLKLISNVKQTQKIGLAAQERVLRKFGEKQFYKSIKQLITWQK